MLSLATTLLQLLYIDKAVSSRIIFFTFGLKWQEFGLHLSVWGVCKRDHIAGVSSDIWADMYLISSDDSCERSHSAGSGYHRRFAPLG
jgi:hypothetical protein